MPADERLVLGQIHAIHLVGGNERLQPLNIRSKLAQHLVRLGRCLLQLLPFQTPDLRDLALNHVFLHGIPPLDTAVSCRSSAVEIQSPSGGNG